MILKLNITGAAQGGLNSTNLKEIKIPLPPPETQQQIVAECEAIDLAVSEAKNEILKSKAIWEEKVNEIYQSNFDKIEISKLSTNIQYGLNEAMNEVGKGFKTFRMNEIINGRMFDNGSMKFADISQQEFEKYRLNKGDILFNRTNSIEHVGKTGIYSLDGEHCFASYLIRVEINSELANPYFVNYMMNSSIFQVEAKGTAAKAINQANINATKMGNIKIPVPPLPEQQKLVSTIEQIEKQIADNQEIINQSAVQKQAVMKKYL